MFKIITFWAMRIAFVLSSAQLVGCGNGGGGGGSNDANPAASSAPASSAPATTTTTTTKTTVVTGTPTATAGSTCTGVGSIQAMSADPDVGAVDVSEYCLGLINGYRSQKGLQPYYLHSTSAGDVCCQAAEAKTAAEIGGHANGGCGWKAQGFCGGARNPNGTVKASMDWCPKMFFEEGPATPPGANHYTAMMETAPRGVMCSFYGVSRDKHSIVVNYY